MAEEFEESEVIFSDHDNNYLGFKEIDREICNNTRRSHTKKRQKKQKQKKSCSSSVPVNIPSNVLQFSDADDFEEEYDGEELVPPHIIIGRRIEGKMAFSVCTGNGRTLKGRNLSQVRNCILRLTGFLET